VSHIYSNSTANSSAAAELAPFRLKCARGPGVPE